VFTDEAVREIARIVWERGTAARGLKSVAEEVLEAVGVRYVVTDATVRGGGQSEHESEGCTVG
jgi:ATP-dependent protease Clp ATPase subunit